MGSATPEQAAHRLLDDRRFPRERYTERRTQSRHGGEELELLTADGRVVAEVSIGRWQDDTWMAFGVAACQNVLDSTD